jgi:uncharacterized iron-regulated membrane protein
VRRVLLLWHRWFGLIAAAWLLLLAVTGTILVFHHELDGALNPDLLKVEERDVPLSHQAVVESIERAMPGHAVDYLLFPEGPRDSLLGFVAPRLATGEPFPDGYVFRQIFVDPYDGRILGTRVFGEAGLDRRRLIPFIYQLHDDLTLGPVATWLLGLLALLWTFDHIASALLSFPAVRRWPKSFMIRRGVQGFKRHFDLHRAIGLWLFPVTLVLAVSGIALTWTETFAKTISTVSPLTDFPIEGLPTQPARDYSPATSLERAIAIARTRPDVGAISAASFHPDLGVYWLRLFDDRDIDLLGRRWIVVRYSDGEILADRHQVDGTTGDVFSAWMLPLHTGEAFGWPGRIVIALSGITLSIVIITGILICARKLRARTKS